MFHSAPIQPAVYVKHQISDDVTYRTLLKLHYVTVAVESADAATTVDYRIIFGSVTCSGADALYR